MGTFFETQCRVIWQDLMHAQRPRQNLSQRNEQIFYWIVESGNIKFIQNVNILCDVYDQETHPAVLLMPGWQKNTNLHIFKITTEMQLMCDMVMSVMLMTDDEKQWLNLWPIKHVHLNTANVLYVKRKQKSRNDLQLLTLSIFTVWLHVMQRMVLLSQFCPSVRLSARRMYCDKTKWWTADILIPHKTAITQVFWHQHWLVGNALSLSNIHQKWTTPFEKRQFRHISAYNVSTIRDSEKSSIMTNIN